MAETGMTFRRRAVTAMASVVALVLAASLGVMSAPPTGAKSRAQNAGGAKYEYDVVSIKTLEPDRRGVDIGTGYAADGLTAHGVRMFWLFRNAYGVTKPEILGAPTWFDEIRFNIDAKLDPATSAELQKLSPDKLKAAQMQMLQVILAERFGLKCHAETRELPAYFLTVAKGGTKLQDAKPDYVGKQDLSDINGNRYKDFVVMEFNNGQETKLVGQAASMKTLAPVSFSIRAFTFG